ncbi:unnamed protein product [Gordionus sp. m RMFG-2023]
MEKVEANRYVYHKNCFKCKTCGINLTLQNYGSFNNNIYCKNKCFKQVWQPHAILHNGKDSNSNPILQQDI